MKALPIHPLLFAIYPILLVFFKNFDEVTIEQLLLPSFLSLLVTTILYLAFRLLMKTWAGAAVATTSITTIYLIYGLIDPSENMRVHPLLILSATAMLMYFNYRQFDYSRLTKHLNFFALIFISLSSLAPLVSHRQATTTHTQISNKNLPKSNLGPNDKKPNIIFLMLDGYAANSTLQKYYNFNNSPFIETLHNFGFTVPKASQSNYAQTYISLASMLNVDYHNEIIPDPNDRTAMYKKTHHNVIMTFLKANGYKVINFSSGWGPTKQLESADVNVACGKFDEFFTVATRPTLLRATRSVLEKAANNYRSKAECAFEKIKDYQKRLFNKSQTPYMLFAHMVMPHPPFIFDSQCKPLPQPVMAYEAQTIGYHKFYIGQLECTNKKLSELLASLPQSPDERPIIVLQSDHGPASMSIANKPLPGREGDYIYERMANFIAFYLPNKQLNIERLSPVNTFRIILNHSFQTDLPLLPDKQYFSSYEDPYKFTDKTTLFTNERKK